MKGEKALADLNAVWSDKPPADMGLAMKYHEKSGARHERGLIERKNEITGYG